MVAYNFQSQFVPAIQSGEKTHTIRRNGKRPHAKPGDELQLYFGMRTKHCQKIRDARCVANLPVQIFVRKDGIGWIRLGSVLTHTPAELDNFAKADGFPDIEAMHGFWLDFHGVGKFEGRFIEWEPA